MSLLSVPPKCPPTSYTRVCVLISSYTSKVQWPWVSSQGKGPCVRGEHSRNIKVLKVFEILGREIAIFLIVCGKCTCFLVLSWAVFIITFLEINRLLKKCLSLSVFLSFHCFVISLSDIPPLIIMDSQEIVVYCWSRSSLFSSAFLLMKLQYGWCTQWF